MYETLSFIKWIARRAVSPRQVDVRQTLRGCFRSEISDTETMPAVLYPSSFTAKEGNLTFTDQASSHLKPVRLLAISS
jgi:hypothetical protein